MSARVSRATGIVDEPAIMGAFAREGLSPERWSNGPRDNYAEHRHAYTKVLYCLAGSIVFHLPASGENIELCPGDRLEIDAGTAHAATVGNAGVTCIEAAR